MPDNQRAENTSRFLRATLAYGRYTKNIEKAFERNKTGDFITDYLREGDAQYPRKVYMGLNQG